MKNDVKLIALILTVIAVISLCGCASVTNPAPASPEAEAAAGTYTFYALFMDDHYIGLEEFEGRTTTLNADGGGALDWGDDNKGPISEWTIDGEKIVIKAGVSEMNATLKDGILIIDFSDEDMPMSTVFVKDEADTSSMPVISVDEYSELISAE